jgi:hypothetical protein
MAFVPYLQAPDLTTFNVADASAAQIAAACHILDGILGKPEGLLWSPDGNDAPAFMTNMSPTRSFKLSAAISPGQGISVSLSGAQFNNSSLGDVVVLDRSTADIAEACVITAVSGNTITLQNVQFNHAPQATVDFGLTLLEELPLRRGMPFIRAKRFPIAQLLAAFARYGFSQPPVQITDMPVGFAAQLLAQEMGTVAPHAWGQIDISQWDINYATGAITIFPYNLAGTNVDIRLRYVAGWSIDNLPDGIKQAVANITRAIINSPYGSNIKTLKSGDGMMEWFKPGMIDVDTAALIQPYRTMRI